MSTVIVSVLSGITGMFAWGVYDFLGGVFSRQIGPFRSLFWSQLAGATAVLVLALASSTSLDIPTSVIVLLPLAAFLYSAGYLLYFRGLEIGNISVVSASMNLWAVFTMMFAFLFMGQRLSTVQTVGVVMILSGVTLATARGSGIKGEGVRLSSGVKETVLGSLFFGIFWNISEMISEQVGWLRSTVLVKAGIVVCLLLFAALGRRPIDMATESRRTKYAVLLAGVIEAGAVAIVNYGLTVGEGILITPIASALSIVTISLAIVLLKEKVTKLQGLGMLTAIMGIVVAALQP